MTVWVAIFTAGLTSYALRCVPIVLVRRHLFQRQTDAKSNETNMIRFLDLAAAAVIGSIIWSSAYNGSSGQAPYPFETIAKPLALAASFMVTRRLKNITLSFSIVLLGYALILMLGSGFYR